ncbi:S8 family serine peptidase [Sphingomonas oligophenolica]|uniref:S8 family serine peptidase n=1 Tax=Sphingomonas oligophenolica TaxID=301154 RepID=A0ABU9Y447_9SPHN
MPEALGRTFTGRGVRIAVIDSGVHPDHPHIRADHVLPGRAIAPDGTMLAGDDAALDRLGHGTAVTAAIQEKAPDAEILPMRVFHDTLKTSARALAAAIGLSLDLGADVINLSLGTVNPAHGALFAGLATRAAEQGALIVAAREANGAPCLPGALEGVLGVGLDWDVPRETWRVENGVLYASGYPRPIPGVPLQHNLYGISFATAQASGFAACACERLRSTGADETLLAALLQLDAIAAV